VIVGLVVFVGSLAISEPFPRAVLEGLGAAFLAMLVCGVGKRFGGGGEVSKATAAPPAVEFVEAAQEPIRAVNERVDAQVGEIEERLYALEKEVAKNEGSDELDEARKPNQNRQ
jgi:hypothetical protein